MADTKDKNKNNMALFSSPMQPLDEAEERKYAVSLQGTATNALAQVTQKEVCEQQSLFDAGNLDALTDKSNIVVVKGQVAYILPYGGNYLIDGRLIQVMRHILQKYSEAIFFCQSREEQLSLKMRKVTLTVKEISKTFNMTPKGAQKMLERTLATLYELSANWKETVYPKDHHTGKRGKPIKEKVYEVRFLGSKERTAPLGDNGERTEKSELLLQHGSATVRIDEEFANYFLDTYTYVVPMGFYKLNPKYLPYSINFADIILTHYRKNYDKTTRNVIKVNYFLEAVGMQKYNKEKGRVYQLLFAPFNRNMNALKQHGIIKDWHLCKGPASRPIKLTDKELQKMKYSDFITYSVKFELPDDFPKFNYDAAIPMLSPGSTEPDMDAEMGIEEANIL